jgi:hypothetical protein
LATLTAATTTHHAAADARMLVRDCAGERVGSARAIEVADMVACISIGTTRLPVRSWTHTSNTRKAGSQENSFTSKIARGSTPEKLPLSLKSGK